MPSQPAPLPFLLPSLPESVVHYIYASLDATQPSRVELFNLPALSTSGQISRAFKAALAPHELDIESIKLHIKHSGSLVQVEDVHPFSGRAKVTPLFSHPSGSAVTEQLSHAGGAILQLASPAAAALLLKGWPSNMAPTWPQDHILPSADLHELARPGFSVAQKHADEWMNRFEGGDIEEQQQSMDPATLSNRARKRLAAEEQVHAKLARKQRKKSRKEAEAEGGEWTLVTRGGPKGAASSQTLNTQHSQQASQKLAKSKSQDKQRKGLMVDNHGNVQESSKKQKSKFMPADFYRNKKDAQRKKGVCIHGDSCISWVLTLHFSHREPSG